MMDDSQGARTQEELEDEEDYRIAVARLKDGLPTIPLDEVVRQLGLEP
jgi:hypothetical protein